MEGSKLFEKRIDYLKKGLIILKKDYMNRLKEVMRGPAVSVETWL
jgi:hypothetical protein